MDVNTTSLRDVPSIPDESTRIKIVQLSGPIKIIMPVKDCTNNKHTDLDKESDAPESCASVCATNKTMIEQSSSSPIDGHHGGDCDDGGRKFLAHNSEVINLVIPITTGDTEVKEFDCNNPDDTMSRL